MRYDIDSFCILKWRITGCLLYTSAVIGDGALSGGMGFEALNNAAALKTNMVIVVNDNKMSIAPNVGGRCV